MPRGPRGPRSRGPTGPSASLWRKTGAARVTREPTRRVGALAERLPLGRRPGGRGVDPALHGPRRLSPGTDGFLEGARLRGSARGRTVRRPGRPGGEGDAARRRRSGGGCRGPSPPAGSARRRENSRSRRPPAGIVVVADLPGAAAGRVHRRRAWARRRSRWRKYERPTFEVVLDEPAAALRLGAPARLTGRAVYYFGLPVTHGHVRWQVTREPIYDWWQWDRRHGSGTVGKGTSAPGADGSFEIAFTPGWTRGTLAS